MTGSGPPIIPRTPNSCELSSQSQKQIFSRGSVFCTFGLQTNTHLLCGSMAQCLMAKTKNSCPFDLPVWLQRHGATRWCWHFLPTPISPSLKLFTKQSCHLPRLAKAIGLWGFKLLCQVKSLCILLLNCQLRPSFKSDATVSTFHAII